MLKLNPSALAETWARNFAEDRDEYRKVALLFAYLFFVVSASTIGRTAADTLFLSRFDASKLSMMYLPQSAVMIAAGFLYQRYGSRLRIDRFILALIPLLSLLVVVSRLGVGLELIWVFPTIYIGYDVFNFLMIVCFWQFASTIMDQRKAKRMIGLVGSGGITGGIVSGFGLKAIVPLIGTTNLIYVYAVLQLLCLAVVFALLRLSGDRQTLFAADKSPKKTSGQASKHTEKKEQSGLFRSVPHLKYVAIMSAALVLSLTLIDYQFKVILRNTLQNEALAGFMGSFYGFSGLLALAVQLFVSGKLLSRFGVMTALLVFPVVLFAGSVGVLLLPVLAMAVAVKGSDKVVGDTIYSSVSQLIMFPIPPKWRGRAKGFLDGIVRNGAKGLAAICLLLISRLIAPEQFSYIVLLLLGVCIVSAIKIKQAYMQTLLSTLETRGDEIDNTELDWMDAGSRQVLTEALSSPDKNKALSALGMLRKAGKFDLAPLLPGLLRHPAPEVRAEALFHAERVMPPGLEPQLLQLLDAGPPAVRAGALTALAAYAKDEYVERIASFLEEDDARLKTAAIAGLIKYYGIDGMFLAVGALKELIGSVRDAERSEVAALFGAIGIKSFYKPLIPLLQDVSPQVRNSALGSAARLRVAELVPLVTAQLAESSTRRKAVEALAAYDESVILPLLSDYWVREGVSVQLPAVYEKIGTPAAFDALLDRYESAPLSVREKLSDAMPRMNRDGSQTTAARIEKLISFEIGQYWQFAEHGGPIAGDRAHQEMREAIQAIRSDALKRMFQLLSLLYEAGTVRAVFHNWTEGDARQQANAAEVIDQLVQGKLRTELTKLMSAPRTLADIRVQPAAIREHLHWLYEHGDEWLRQLIAAEALSGGSNESGAAPNAPGPWSGHPAARDQAHVDRMLDLIGRVKLLGNVTLFRGLTGLSLSAIAPMLQKVELGAGEIVIREGEPGDSLFIVGSGQAAVYRGDLRVVGLPPGSCFGETAVLTRGLRTATIKTKEPAQLWRLDSSAFYELIADEPSVGFEMMKLLSRRMRSALDQSGGSPAPAHPEAAASAEAGTATAGGAGSDNKRNDVLLRRIIVLQKIEWFARLSGDDFVRLARAAEEVTYAPGEPICRTGQFGDKMYGILEGSVRVHRDSETFATLKEGECFGEMAIIDSGVRSADCTAITETVVLQLHQEQVRALCFQNADVLRSMMRAMADRLTGMA